jgi:signal transduction histidine kinase
LYICKGIIEAHGGRIWAKNNPIGSGKSGGGGVSSSSGDDGVGGATFSFSLPLAQT